MVSRVLSLFAAIALVAPLVLLSGCSKPDLSRKSVQTGTDSQNLFQEKSLWNFGLSGSKKLVLTFDDGPTPSVTSAILDILKKEKVHAGFFLVGRNISGNENLLVRMANEGHIIANHTTHHHSLRGEDFLDRPENVIKEIETTHDLMRPFLNGTHRLYFRAPHGAWSSNHAHHLNAIPKLRPYIGPMFWNIGGALIPKPEKNLLYEATTESIQTAADWHCWSKGVSVKVCTAGYLKEIESKQGGVILFHDVNVNTVQMVKVMIPELKRRGFQFITLDQIDDIGLYQ